MKIDEFLARLQRVEGDGRGGWMACCPAHDDHNPSMHVNVGRDGRILVKCFAGCSAEEIVGALGLKKSDLMADEGKARGSRRANGTRQGRAEETRGLRARLQDGAGAAADATAAEPRTGRAPDAAPSGVAEPDALPGVAAPKKPRDYGRLVCEYVYKREDGAVVYKVQRRVKKDGRKTFIQMTPDPSARGGWAFGVAKQGVDYIPYQLPLVRKAAHAGKSVVILEGEKDVCTFIKRFKAAATCNPKGAGKWQAGWGRYFEGVQSVLIIADNDPATKVDKKTGEEKPFHVGQRHACDVEAKLRADGYEGRIRKAVMPDVAGRHVKDFTDWVEAMEAAGRTVDRAAFAEALEESGDWPVAWEFGAAAPGDLQRAQKEARVSASPSAAAAPAPSASAMPGEGGCEGDEVGEAPGSDGKGCGRFGRPVPAPRASGVRTYEVDYRLNASRTARFEVGVGFYRFRGWQKSDGDDKSQGRKVPKGEYFLASDNEPVRLALSSMFAMAYGNVIRFGGDSFKLGSRNSSEIQAAITLLWLRSRGKFFWDENAKGFATSLFFDEQTGVLMRVRSDEFAAFVATESEVNREASGFKFLMSLIDDAAMSDQVSRGVVPSNMWDRRGDAVFISSGDAEMYRIRDGAVEKVQNGTDGVVFMRGKTLAPWRLDAGPGVDPFDKALIFSGASWADANGRMNVRLWVLNLFACHATKPLLLITGEMQSGKTRMAKAIKEILGVRQDGRLDLSVQQVEDGDKGLDAFWATVNDGKLEVFDNLDTKVKWVSDTLQNVATDGQTKRRTLYTTFGVSILRANAHIILTSNNPLFSTEGNGGMADRLISVHLSTNRSVARDTELSEDIAKNRDQYLTWIARTVAAALADKGEVDQSINRRHPDYGRFSVRCGRAFGDVRGVVAALGAAEADKSLLPLRNDLITREILHVLETCEPPYSMRFTSGDMSEAILSRMGDDDTDDKSKTIYGARRVGKALSRYLRQFAVIFRMAEPRILQGKTLYEFMGLTEAGRLAMAKEVDKVDLKATFQNSTHISEGAGGFSENGTLNPPNPPYARARPCASPFEKDKVDSNVNNEDEEGLDDLFF